MPALCFDAGAEFDLTVRNIAIFQQALSLDDNRTCEVVSALSPDNSVRYEKGHTHSRQPWLGGYHSHPPGDCDADDRAGIGADDRAKEMPIRPASDISAGISEPVANQRSCARIRKTLKMGGLYHENNE